MTKRTGRKRPPPQGHRQGGRPVAQVDITIPVFGEWALCEKTLAALPAAAEGLDGGYRVILIDNGTPPFQLDGENNLITPEMQAEKVKEMLRPQDQFVRLETNVGYPMAQNEAARRGRSPLILILTSDVELAPGSIAVMVKEMEQEEVGVVGPLLVFPEGSPHGPAGAVQHAGIAFGIRGKPFHIFVGWNPEHPKVNQRREMLAVTGACFMTRRALWQAVAGFPDVYGAGTFEDMDYCFSVRSLGGKVIFQPEAKGTHWVGGSVKQGAGAQGFPLMINETVFKGRWAHLLAWDEWEYW